MVKEWLLLMAASDVVKVCDGTGDKFRLPLHMREVVTSPYCAIESRAKFEVLHALQSGALMEYMKLGGPESEKVKWAIFSLIIILCRHTVLL